MLILVYKKLCTYIDVTRSETAGTFDFQESCITAVESVARAVNEQHYDIKTNVYLSIFKLAEVDVTYPESSAASFVRRSTYLIGFFPFLIYAINGN